MSGSQGSNSFDLASASFTPGNSSADIGGATYYPGSATALPPFGSQTILPSVGGETYYQSPDFRVRISPLSDTFYGSGGILSPLDPRSNGSNGVLFPFSPNITESRDVDYASIGMTHTNTDYYSYQRTPSLSLTITGKFTVQNQVEGAYALAAIHFFRTASKMYFGKAAGAKAGLPPPMLVLNGYGTYMYNNLRCIMKNAGFSYTDGIDTVPVTAGGGVTRLPAMFDLNCTLVIQQTPKMMVEEFDLDAFRTGALLKSGGWV